MFLWFIIKNKILLKMKNSSPEKNCIKHILTSWPVVMVNKQVSQSIIAILSLVLQPVIYKLCHLVTSEMIQYMWEEY